MGFLSCRLSRSGVEENMYANGREDNENQGTSHGDWVVGLCRTERPRI